MAERIKLEHQIFGKLTVISYEGNKKYLCKCECGTERLIFSKSLRNGKSSCGCAGINCKNRFKDLTNKKFGKLSVVRKSENLRKKRAYWICQCECGKEVDVRGSHLLSGCIKNCGCVNEINLKDKKFGKLHVLNFTGKSTSMGRSKIWLCKCECGNQKEVSCRMLMSGEVKSCGCLYLDNILDYTEAKKNHLFSNHRSGAVQRKIDFKLSEDEVFKLCQSNCFYCGCEPKNEKYLRTINKDLGRKTIIYQGIDRVNSNLGYITNNCVPCCKICNVCKSTLTKEEWIQKMKDILKNLGEI